MQFQLGSSLPSVDAVKDFLSLKLINAAKRGVFIKRRVRI